jgi:CheY-like chemotaxis protein
VVTAIVDLQIEAGGDAPLWVRADPTQLQQVLLNLAINARDAMPAGGTLRIRAEDVPRDVPTELALGCAPADRYVRLTVQDSGTGIPPEAREHIFEPFFTTKQRGRGTGLGLSIVHGIVQHHGGAVAVDSEPDRGTTVTVYLPRQSEPAADDEHALHPPVPAGRGERILIAEDDVHVREIMVTTLRSLGYSVDGVGDGPAVFNALTSRAGAYRLLVLDVDLPGIDGFTCLQTLRARGIDTPTVVISGNPDLDQAAVQAAHATLLLKPFQMGELGRVAGRAIESRTPAGAGARPQP